VAVAREAWRKVRQPEGYISVEPLPSPEELRAFYAEQYYQQTVSASYQASYSEEELSYKRLQARVFLHAIGRGDDGAPSLLDVGCGEGFLLAEAQTQGWSVKGIDFGAYAVDRFHPALAEHLELGEASEILDRFVAEKRRFEACVLQNVLEHVIDPRGLLGKMRALLAPEGKLLVTLPNDYSGVQQTALKTKLVDHEYWFVPPQHLHYFDIAAASALSRACGYDVKDVFADFPIEVFLFHPGSNYVRAREVGPAAHKARMALSLICAQAGLDSYLDLSRAYARCGIGRAFTLVLTDAQTK
jgi:2-polyprenyl-3-methyl-5-hydroxy-6-metoxy-1,4-benzoquinol methylase